MASEKYVMKPTGQNSEKAECCICLHIKPVIKNFCIGNHSDALCEECLNLLTKKSLSCPICRRRMNTSITRLIDVWQKAKNCGWYVEIIEGKHYILPPIKSVWNCWATNYRPYTFNNQTVYVPAYFFDAMK